MNNEKVTLLSRYEQNIQQLLTQRQMFNSQLAEVESALKEIENSQKTYKIIGNIMVLSDKENLKKELEEKKKLFELRISSLEKQEASIKEKADALQKEILKDMAKK